ncbi:hypothetical protein [Oceaniradius stylonematis]|uniref:hypothetical protein n=1 Tax=Oceaniradius stylonematis TaxID=2184161 RepID=UPI003C7E734F
MFGPRRIVAIDDKVEHLEFLKGALHAAGADCHPVHYTDEHGVGDLTLTGVRVLFLDLHLVTGGGAATVQTTHFGVLAGLLDQCVNPSSGPYVIVLWTEYATQVEGFRAYLDGLDPGSLTYQKRPVAIYALNKSDFFNTTSGAPNTDADLTAAIRGKLAENPQMKALFEWETDVHAAIDATLRSIVELVPEDQRSSTDFGPALGQVLYRISEAGAGVGRATENPRESVNRVLVPVLADRISEHDPLGQATNNWQAALVTPSGIPTVEQQARVNDAIHVSCGSPPPSAPLRATDLGAVVEFPSDDPEALLPEWFGLEIDDLKRTKFLDLSDENDWNECSLCLVQVGAVCDHAQPNPGPLLYLLGVEWKITHPSAPKRLSHKRKPSKSGREWSSPIILVGEDRLPGRISVFLNCSISVTRASAEPWVVKYRFRDELISQLTHEYARYISRPGITSL